MERGESRGKVDKIYSVTECPPGIDEQSCERAVREYRSDPSKLPEDLFEAPEREIILNWLNDKRQAGQTVKKEV